MGRRFGLLVLAFGTALAAVSGFAVGSGSATEGPLVIGAHLPDYQVDYLVFLDPSDSKYKARKSIDGTILATTSTDDIGAVIEAADANATASALIGVTSGTFTTKTQISLDSGTGLIGTGADLTSTPTRYTVIKAITGFSTSAAVVTTNGVAGNSSLRNISIDGANIATNAFDAETADVRLDSVAFSGGTDKTLLVNANRGTADLVTVQRGSGTATIGLYVAGGSDWNWTNLRVVDGAYTTVVHVLGSGFLFDTCHFTGGASTVTNTKIGGGRNRFVNCYFDSVHSGPLVENIAGNNLVANAWFKATSLDATTYSMVKVSAGDFILMGSQVDPPTPNLWQYGFETPATGSVTTVVGNQFRGVNQPTVPWNNTPTTHAGNTMNGTCVDTC
jgi:hypothetical protein